MKTFIHRLFSLPFIQLSGANVWMLLGIVSWTVPLGNFVWLGKPYVQNGKIFLVTTSASYLIVFGGLLIQAVLIRRIIGQYPGIEQTPKRIALELGVFVLMNTVVTVLIFWGVYKQVGVYERMATFAPTFSTYVTIGCISITASFLTVGLYESYYTFQKWKEKTLMAEAYKREALVNQLEILKNQVNPHFLFNSLNVLSMLITEEPRQAEQFVEQLARVYRYLLQTNDQDLACLSQELDFIEAYYHLLRTRYQQGVELSIEVAASYREWLLPPLTLQLLVENAVKHNRIQPHQPLRITIGVTEEGWLRVGNNLQRKTTRVVSHQVGLANIASKYRLLAQPEPVISDTDGHFVVTMPLLAPALI